jgi:hypothetical protein
MTKSLWLIENYLGMLLEYSPEIQKKLRMQFRKNLGAAARHYNPENPKTYFTRRRSFNAPIREKDRPPETRLRYGFEKILAGK